MKIIHTLFTSLFCLLIGAFFFCYQRGWVIVNLPTNKSSQKTLSLQQASSKKEIQFFFWHRQQWKTEPSLLLWSKNVSTNLHLLINSWLTLLDEENIISKKITLQTAILSPVGDHVFLSFDRNPLPEQASTYLKWMLIESLLKTIRHNCNTLNTVSFLVHHQPLRDDHLDFSNPWPISGFLP